MTPIHPLLRWSDQAKRWEFIMSANSDGIGQRCDYAFWIYKVLGRRAVRSQAGLIAGTAMHEGLRLAQAGAAPADQEAAIERILLDTPTPADDYRQAPYLKDALAAFRAEMSSLFAGWSIEEQEQQGMVQLGTLPYSETYTGREVSVTLLWEFRRDMVALTPDGLRLIVDWKTASRNEEAHYAAMRNSGQFMGYCVSWTIQHPDKPIHGVQPVRLVMRKPSRTGAAFEFPKDPPIYFQQERLEEWRRHRLVIAQRILERDPWCPDDWPLATAELGCCRHTFGCCDYLQACTLVPNQRKQYLLTDAFEPSDLKDKTMKDKPSPELLAEAKEIDRRYWAALDEYNAASRALDDFVKRANISDSVMNGRSDLQRWLIEAMS